MTVTYLKKAAKTPLTGTDETQKIVGEMLAKIEEGGEAAALDYGLKLDGYKGKRLSQKSKSKKQGQNYLTS